MQFVVAALVAAVFLVDWPLDADELRRRFYQIALAFCLVAFMLALGLLLFPTEAAAGTLFTDETVEAARVLRERLTLNVAAGLILIFAALSVWMPWPTLSVSGLLAGVLLLLGAATFDQAFYATAISEVIMRAGPTRNLIYTAVLGAGTIGLLLFGYNQWDRPQQDLEEPDMEESVRG